MKTNLYKPLFFTLFASSLMLITSPVMSEAQHEPLAGNGVLLEEQANNTKNCSHDSVSQAVYCANLAPNSERFTNGDVNGDGLDDIVFYNSNTGKWTFILGNGAGAFGFQSSFQWTGTSFGKAFTGDFNGDGLLDIGLYNPNNLRNWYIQYGDGLGNFGNQTAWPWVASTPIGSQVFSGDFNGDGYWDIGLFNPNNLQNWYIQYGDGSGAFGGQTAWHWPGLNSNSPIYTGDFNGDGLWDIGAYNPNNVGYWFIQYGAGNGSFGAQTAWPWGPHGYGAPFSGDFNGDGFSDVGFYNPNNQYNWFIQYGLGSGAFGGQTAWHVGDASNW